MPTRLPSDPILLEQTIAGAIKDIFLSVPIVATYAKVEARERFPDNDEADILISTVPDPANPDDLVFTSLIQVGIPTVRESQYTNDISTQLDFTYPITFDMDVRDSWANQDGSLEYTNSRALFMAIYMMSRKAFKFDRTLGFENCAHDYLQQESVGTIQDDGDSGKSMHVADWSLTVHVTGVSV